MNWWPRRAARRSDRASRGSPASRCWTRRGSGAKGLSGVNLDEEAANLIRFEQAYNASAQVISVARAVLDALFDALA